MPRSSSSLADQESPCDSLLMRSKRAKCSIEPQVLKQMIKNKVTENPAEHDDWMGMDSDGIITKYSSLLMCISEETERLSKHIVKPVVKKLFELSVDQADLWANQLTRAFSKARRFRSDTTRLPEQLSKTLRYIQKQIGPAKSPSPSPSPSPPAWRPVKEAERVWDKVLGKATDDDEGRQSAEGRPGDEADKIWAQILKPAGDTLETDLEVLSDLLGENPGDATVPVEKTERPVISNIHMP